jgi:hypothetical protein
MSDVVDQYRKLADKARSDAAGASLPNVQQQHLRSVARLEEIIAGLENVFQAKARNEEARRNGS